MRRHGLRVWPRRGRTLPRCFGKELQSSKSAAKKRAENEKEHDLRQRQHVLGRGLPSWVPRVTNGDHTTLRGAGGQRVRRTKLYTHTGRREHDGPTVVGTTCRPVTVSHVVPTYSTYVTHSRHLHTTVRVSYLRPTSYGVARVPLDTLLPTRRVGYVRIFQHTLLLEHSATITLRSRGGHTPYQTFCRCSAKRLPLLSCCRLSCLLSTGGDITFLPKRDQSAAERAARGMHRALCASARARGLAAASYAIVLPLHTMRRVGIHRDVGISP